MGLAWRKTQDPQTHSFVQAVNQEVAIPTTYILIWADSRTRINHQQKFCVIPANTEAYKNSFFPRTIREWNVLDAWLVDSPSMDAFRERMKSPVGSNRERHPSAHKLHWRFCWLPIQMQIIFKRNLRLWIQWESVYLHRRFRMWNSSMNGVSCRPLKKSESIRKYSGLIKRWYTSFVGNDNLQQKLGFSTHCIIKTSLSPGRWNQSNADV